MKIKKIYDDIKLGFEVALDFVSVFCVWAVFPLHFIFYLILYGGGGLMNMLTIVLAVIVTANYIKIMRELK
jgi:hypothetical protein